MPNLPPSLGDDAKKKLFLVHEEMPLPPNRKELLTAFENILSQGGVQKVVVELGRPIKISRYAQDSAEPLPLAEDDIFANIRNSEMQEFVLSPELPIHEYLFKAFNILSQKKLRARAFLVRDLTLLRKCLGVDLMWDLGELYGVDVVSSESIPEDVILLAASKHGEEDISLSLRMLMNTPRRK